MALDSLFDYSLAAITCILVIICVRLTTRKHVNSKSDGVKSLPGPWGIPLLGNMLTLGKSAPHIALTNLSKKFGSMYQIRLGSRPVLVLNGYDAINKALVKQAAIFAGRPQLFSTNLFLSCCPGNHNLTFGSCGERYTLHRKLAESSLHHFTSGTKSKFVDLVVTSEVTELVEIIKTKYSFTFTDKNMSVSSGSSRNQSPDLQEMRNDIYLTIANVMCRFLFGERCSYHDMGMQNLLLYSKRFSEANKAGNPTDFLPWLRFLYAKNTKTYLSTLEELRASILDMVRHHHQEYTPGSKEDIMDHLVTSGRHGKEHFDQVGLSEDMLLDTAIDFVGAGFETTSATLEWCILYLAAYPEIQISLQSEIDSVIGRSRLPTLDDRADLPLIQAFLLEVHRHSNMVPFTIPHSTISNTVLDGFFVPKDIIVFVNIYSAHIDPMVWSEPDVFNPNRFLAPDGTLDQNKKSHVIPFGVGRRRCLGADLARMELFLFLSIFVQQFSFQNPREEALPMAADEGLLRTPKELTVRIISRHMEKCNT